MACDVQTLENLLTVDGFAALSDHDFLICLAGAFLAVSGIDAQTAVTNAAANGYQKLSDLELDQALLAVFTATSYDAQSIVNTIGTQKDDALDRRDLLLAQVAAYCAGTMTTAQAIENLLTSNGYRAFCQFDALRALLAVCSSSPLIGALDWAARVVQNGGAVPAAGTVSAISTFLTSISSIRSKIKHLNVIAPDSLIAMRTPLIADYGLGFWQPHTVGAGFVETIGVGGWRGCSSAGNGIVYDTGVVPSAIASFNIGNGGLSACCPNTTPTASTVYLTGSDNGASSVMAIITSGGGTTKVAIGATSIVAAVATVGGAFYSANRVSTTDLSLSWGTSTSPYAKATTNAAANTIAPGGTPIACGGENLNGTFLACPQSVSFHCVHDGLSLAEGTILFNAVSALRTAFGGGFV